MAADTTLGLQTCLALGPEGPGSEAGWAAELGPISIAAGGFLFVCLFCCWFFGFCFFGGYQSVLSLVYFGTNQCYCCLVWANQSCCLFILLFTMLGIKTRATSNFCCCCFSSKLYAMDISGRWVSVPGDLDGKRRGRILSI